jgi:hypothetical protein
MFYLPDEMCPCRILEASGVPVIPHDLERSLTTQYCDSGCFIACPIFQRLQDTLAKVHTMGPASLYEEQRHRAA